MGFLNEHSFTEIPNVNDLGAIFKTEYNQVRPHSALKCYTPDAFRTRAMAYISGGATK